MPGQPCVRGPHHCGRASAASPAPDRAHGPGDGAGLVYAQQNIIHQPTLSAPLHTTPHPLFSFRSEHTPMQTIPSPSPNFNHPGGLPQHLPGQPCVRGPHHCRRASAASPASDRAHGPGDGAGLARSRQVMRLLARGSVDRFALGECGGVWAHGSRQIYMFAQHSRPSPRTESAACKYFMHGDYLPQPATKMCRPKQITVPSAHLFHPS